MCVVVFCPVLIAHASFANKFHVLTSVHNKLLRDLSVLPERYLLKTWRTHPNSGVFFLFTFELVFFPLQFADVRFADVAHTNTQGADVSSINVDLWTRVRRWWCEFIFLWFCSVEPNHGSNRPPYGECGRHSTLRVWSYWLSSAQHHMVQGTYKNSIKSALKSQSVLCVRSCLIHGWYLCLGQC